MEYAIDLLFELDEIDRPDGTHYALQWAMSQDPGDGWAQLPIQGRTGTDPAPGEHGDYGFGRANLQVNTGDGFAVSVFTTATFDANTSDPNEVKRLDFVRLTIRPSHEMSVDSALPVSPFNSRDTDNLVRGQAVDAMDPDAESAGFQQTYTSGAGTVLEASFLAVPASYDTLDFEISAYVGVRMGDDSLRYYKSDPELIIGKRPT